MYQTIKKVLPQENYQLLLTFEGGEDKIFDMTPYLSLGFFKELKIKEMFYSVHLSFDTIEWDNGADMDPETLYADSKPITPIIYIPFSLELRN